jgi:hypothetical protein
MPLNNTTPTTTTCIPTSAVQIESLYLTLNLAEEDAWQIRHENLLKRQFSDLPERQRHVFSGEVLHVWEINDVPHFQILLIDSADSCEHEFQKVALNGKLSPAGEGFRASDLEMHFAIDDYFGETI